MDRDIQKGKTNVSTAIPPALDVKSPVNFGPLTTVYTRLMFRPTHQIEFLKYHISAPSWRCALKFLCALELTQGLLVCTPAAMGV